MAERDPDGRWRCEVCDGVVWRSGACLDASCPGHLTHGCLPRDLPEEAVDDRR